MASTGGETSKLLTDIPNEIDKHLLPDGDYDITGLLQAQRDLTAEIVLKEVMDKVGCLFWIDDDGKTAGLLVTGSVVYSELEALKSSA